jgi:hypothetical protein
MVPLSSLTRYITCSVGATVQKGAQQASISPVVINLDTTFGVLKLIEA